MSGPFADRGIENRGFHKIRWRDIERALRDGGVENIPLLSFAPNKLIRAR